MNDLISKVLKSKKCAICGEQFCRLDYTNYLYKIKQKFCCSYTCWRKLQKIEEEKNKNKRKRNNGII